MGVRLEILDFQSQVYVSAALQAEYVEKPHGNGAKNERRIRKREESKKNILIVMKSMKSRAKERTAGWRTFWQTLIYPN